MRPIEFNRIWKKFKKGKTVYSLRDWIPHKVKTLSRRKIKQNEALQGAEFWALKDVDFEVRKGDVLGIIGPNGAGKSTILKLLSRILKPDRGQIKIRGRLSALIEITAGFHPEFTGRENVYLNGALLGMSKREIDRKFDKIVEFSGVEEFIDTPVKRYSSGMYARLGFSIAAHVEPDILLVDEVLSVGDMPFRAKCAQKMRGLLNSGTTIVLISHSLSLIQNLCKRVILLNRGRIIKEGAADEVIPCYQNIVYKESEDELYRKFSQDNSGLKLNQQTPVKILNVRFNDGLYKNKDSFKVGEPISISVDYKTQEEIQRPVFSIDIIRADGVLCCVSNTKDDSFAPERLYGRGTINIDLGTINLAPGAYLIKIAILDQDMIHAYVINKEAIMRIETTDFNRNMNSVFLHKVRWQLEQREP